MNNTFTFFEFVNDSEITYSEVTFKCTYYSNKILEKKVKKF